MFKLFYCGLSLIRPILKIIPALFLFAVLLAACSSKNPDASEKMRIVSVLPSYTEILFEIGAGENIVGVSNFCDKPDAAKEIEKIGDYYTASAEKIYSLKPTIVFIQESSASRLGDDLQKLKINAVHIQQEQTIEDIFKTIRILSEKTGHTKQGQELIERLASSMPKNISEKNKPRIYIDVDAGLWTCGKLSYLTDIVNKAGGENIFANEDKNYFQASWETLLKNPPDYILSISGNFKDFSSRPLAETMSAVKNGNVIELDRDIISRPAPSMFPLIKEINARLERH